MGKVGILWLCSMFVIGGCAGHTATPLPSTARLKATTFYVENREGDERSIEYLIAKALRAQGVEASSGDQEQAPEAVDFIVVYKDRWGMNIWDGRWYPLELKIDVLDPRTRKVVGTSQSHQDNWSARDKAYQDFIRETTDRLFGGSAEKVKP